MSGVSLAAGVSMGPYISSGNATLSAGTVVVPCATVNATSMIVMTTKTVGGTQGALFVSAITPGTSFAVTSTSSIDTSTFDWGQLS